MHVIDDDDATQVLKAVPFPYTITTFVRIRVLLHHSHVAAESASQAKALHSTGKKQHSSFSFT
jgi:hypothetical protein